MAKKPSSPKGEGGSRYSRILARIFQAHYKPGIESFEFDRSELETAAAELGVLLPKNLGDLLYSFRFRTALPDVIARTTKPGFEWVILGAGRAKYRMQIRKINRITPSQGRHRIKIPDATPEIVGTYALTDEQALLAKVRYNRLIDTFLRVTAYSLQNHLRTSVPEMGQIEVDEVYVAVNSVGQQFVIPVQAKGGNDQIGVVQVEQDLALCRKAYPNLTPRPVAVQFVREGDEQVIVMFELGEIGGEVKLVNEHHYRLVAAADITEEDLQFARNLPQD